MEKLTKLGRVQNVHVLQALLLLVAGKCIATHRGRCTSISRSTSVLVMLFPAGNLMCGETCRHEWVSGLRPV